MIQKNEDGFVILLSDNPTYSHVDIQTLVFTVHFGLILYMFGTLTDTLERQLAMKSVDWLNEKFHCIIRNLRLIFRSMFLKEV